ncbi:MAG: HNH endonuclease [Candidatus Omnitrophica bacterium]|nr:HNH endonuclease [Candidatus Omnitrophota bacterium]
MFKAGDVISYIEMCQEEGISLQRGMNFRLKGRHSVILMSLRRNAPYADKVEDNGKTLIYEGHDIPRFNRAQDSKLVSQQMQNPGGSLTQNGFFYKAAHDYKNKKSDAELVKVYEKIHSGIWAYNGLFKLVDSWQEESNKRKVFKFRLEIDKINSKGKQPENFDLDRNRLIPASVKLAVWKRDKGKCTKCGSPDNLHFDHIIPYSKGGSSLVAENIQLLCARHNIEKRDRIE